MCYCDDCQSFAHFLGRADEILDAHAGTDVFSTTLAHLEINEGADQIACVRLKPDGMFRWYAGCCRTPIGNTFPSPKSPFISVVHSCMDHASDIRSRDEALGPIRSRANGRFAKGDLSTLEAHPRIPLSMLPLVAKLFVAKLRREHSPSAAYERGWTCQKRMTRSSGGGDWPDGVEPRWRRRVITAGSVIGTTFTS